MHSLLGGFVSTRRPHRTALALLARSLAAVIAFGLAACGSASEPEFDLAGTWRTAPIPSGGGMSVTLVTTGTVVSGTGQSTGIGPNPIITLITVTGSRASNTFTLHFAFATGILSRYSGTVVDGTTLSGSYGIIGQPAADLTFYRQ